jgi:hypothetical protein
MGPFAFTREWTHGLVLNAGNYTREKHFVKQFE